MKFVKVSAGTVSLLTVASVPDAEEDRVRVTADCRHLAGEKNAI